MARNRWIAVALAAVLLALGGGLRESQGDPRGGSDAGFVRVADDGTQRADERRFRGGEPITLTVLAVLVAGLFGSVTRARRLPGAVLGAASAGLLTGGFGALPAWIGLATGLGAVAGWLAPAVQRQRRHRRIGGQHYGEFDDEFSGGSAMGRW